MGTCMEQHEYNHHVTKQSDFGLNGKRGNDQKPSTPNGHKQPQKEARNDRQTHLKPAFGYINHVLDPVG